MGKPQKRNATLEQMAIAMYTETGSGNLTAKRLGLAPSTVYRMLADCGIEVPDRCDPKPKRRKLSDEASIKLVEDYVSGLSIADISGKYGVAQWTIRSYVKRAGVSLRTVGGRKRQLSEDETAEMVRLHVQEGLTRKQISVRFGCCESTVSRALQKAGMVVSHKAYGVNHGSWAGGIITTADGYLKEKVPYGDPMRAMGGRSGYVLQHRLVMARSLGRLLTDHETVHHINGNRSDNDISNLQLRSGKHGVGSVLVCACCGSSNILAKEIA